MNPEYERAYTDLKHRILNLELKPGASLSEAKLAEQYGLSRTPIREALIRLSTDGLIVTRPHRYTKVAPIRYEDVMDAQFAREGLEVAVVDDLAQAPSPQLLGALEKNLEKQEQALRQGNLTRLFELDEQMHKAMASACRRPGIWWLIEERKLHLDRIRKLTLFPDHAPDILAQHRAIVDGIAQTDPVKASEAMRLHLRFIVENYASLARKHPEFVEEPQSTGDGSRRRSPTLAGRPAKLSADQKKAIMRLLIGGDKTGAEVARIYGVSAATISRVRREGTLN